MKAYKILLAICGILVVLIYTNIVLGTPVAQGKGFNQGMFGGLGQDSCGNVEVTSVADNCPTGNDSINSYSLTVTLTNVKSNTPLILNGEMRTYWCTPDQLRGANASTGQGANSCYSNGKTFYTQTPALAKGQSFNFAAPFRSANACRAVYQDDFNYTYSLNGKICHNSISAIRYHAAYGYCSARVACVTPTPTSFSTPSPTVFITSAPTITMVPTTVIPSPTIIQTENNNANTTSEQQNQEQNQYNNNNQTVTVSLASTQPASVAPTSSTVTELPSTGSSVDILELLFTLAPIGMVIRKFT